MRKLQLLLNSRKCVTAVLWPKGEAKLTKYVANNEYLINVCVLLAFFSIGWFLVAHCCNILRLLYCSGVSELDYRNRVGMNRNGRGPSSHTSDLGLDPHNKIRLVAGHGSQYPWSLGRWLLRVEFEISLKNKWRERDSNLGITEFLISYYLLEDTRKTHKKRLLQLYLPISYRRTAKATPKLSTKN